MHKLLKMVHSTIFPAHVSVLARRFSYFLFASVITCRVLSIGNFQHRSATRKVGIVVQGPPVKGIFRDAECIVWALTADLSRPTHVQPSITIFYTYNYALLDQVFPSCSRIDTFHSTVNYLGNLHRILRD